MARVWLCILVLVLCGCSHKVYVPVETAERMVETDSLMRLVSRMIELNNSRREKETLYVFDRITEKATVNEKGDTIGFEKDHERMTNREHELESRVERLEQENDSLRNVKARVDSVFVEKPVEVEVVKTVERRASWWESALMWIGGIGLAAGAVFVAARLRR